jgi:hypothetical protein
MTVPGERANTAADLAAELGPTAFAALVVLALDAEPGEDGRLLVAASARRLAARLGVGKDSAAVALRRLSDTGWLRGPEQRQEGTGRFAVAVRELRPVPGISPCPPPPDTAEPAPPPLASSKRRTVRHPLADDGQLDLFAAGREGDDGDDELEDRESNDGDGESAWSQEVQGRRPGQPSLFDQALEPVGRVGEGPVGETGTRLHRGCDDVADASPRPGAPPC